MLKSLEKYYENSHEIVFFLDHETQKIVYMNHAGCKYYGYDYELRDYAGLLCAKVLHDRDLLCENCVRDRLVLNQFDEQEIFNDEIGQYVLMKSTLVEEDGKLYQISVAENYEKEWKRRHALTELVDMESIIDKSLELAMNEEDPDRAIALLFDYLGNHLHCDRVYIFEENDDGTFSNTYEWCREGVTPEKNRLQHLPYEGTVETWYKEFDKSRNIMIRNIEQYKFQNPIVYEILKPQHIKTLVVGPLVVYHQRIGFYGVDNPPYESIDNISMIYDVLGHFLAAMLRHRDNERKVLYDDLSGAQTRNALRRYMATVNLSDSLCFLFCDINSLKQVNDNLGHAAGDDLIQRTSHILMDCLAPAPVYRMGGDEFLVICAGVTEKEAKKLQEKAMQACRDAGISLAVGMSWRPNSSDSFTTLLNEADARMYDVKLMMHNKTPDKADDETSDGRQKNGKASGKASGKVSTGRVIPRKTSGSGQSPRETM